MTQIAPETFKEAVSACYGLRWIEPAAQAAGVTRRTVERWASGAQPVPEPIAALLRKELAKAHARIVKAAEAIGADLKRDGAKKPPKLTEAEAGVLAVLVQSANKRPELYERAPFRPNEDIFLPLEASPYGIGRGGANNEPEDQYRWLAGLTAKGYLQEHQVHKGLWRIGPNFPQRPATS